MIVPTRADASAEAMMTGTEVYHTLNSAIRRTDGEMHAMSVTRADNDEVSDFRTEALEPDEGVMPRCEGGYVTSTQSEAHDCRASHVAVSFFFSPGCPSQLCAETCRNGGNGLPSWQSQLCFRFLAEREDDEFDDERS